MKVRAMAVSVVVLRQRPDSGASASTARTKSAGAASLSAVRWQRPAGTTDVILACSDTHAMLAPRARAAAEGGEGAAASTRPAVAAFAWGSPKRGALGSEAVSGRSKAIRPSDAIGVACPRLEASSREARSGGATQAPRTSALACGDGFSVMATADGRLWVWGDNSGGALGLEERKSPKQPSLRVPTPLQSLWREDVRVQHVACGAGHAVAVDGNGAIWSWGNGAWGVLGLGDARSVAYPRRVTIPDDSKRDGGDVRVAAVACGPFHCAALSDDGRVFTWGRTLFGRLGSGADTVGGNARRYGPKATWDGWKRKAAAGAPGSKLAAHDVPRRAPATRGFLPTPTRVHGVLDVHRATSVACGSAHTAVTTTKGLVASWGLGRGGRLGHGDCATRSEPTVVTSLIGKGVVAVRAAAAYTCFSLATGEL